MSVPRRAPDPAVGPERQGGKSALLSVFLLLTDGVIHVGEEHRGGGWGWGKRPVRDVPSLPGLSGLQVEMLDRI